MNDTAQRNTIGLDLGDRESSFCILAPGKSEPVDGGKVATTKRALSKLFSRCELARVALEAGTHSAWITDLLEGLGHEVIVANPRRIELITKSDRKNDKNDA